MCHLPPTPAAAACGLPCEMVAIKLCLVQTLKLRTEHRAFLPDICSSNSPQIAFAASEQMFLLSHVQIWFFRNWRCGREHPCGTSWHDIRALTPFKFALMFQTISKHFNLSFHNVSCSCLQSTESSKASSVVEAHPMAGPVQTQAARSLIPMVLHKLTFSQLCTASISSESSSSTDSAKDSVSCSSSCLASPSFTWPCFHSEKNNKNLGLQDETYRFNDGKRILTTNPNLNQPAQTSVLSISKPLSLRGKHCDT